MSTPIKRSYQILTFIPIKRSCQILTSTPIKRHYQLLTSTHIKRSYQVLTSTPIKRSYQVLKSSCSYKKKLLDCHVRPYKKYYQILVVAPIKDRHVRTYKNELTHQLDPKQLVFVIYLVLCIHQISKIPSFNVHLKLVLKRVAHHMAFFLSLRL